MYVIYIIIYMYIYINTQLYNILTFIQILGEQLWMHSKAKSVRQSNKNWSRLNIYIYIYMYDTNHGTTSLDQIQQ